MHKIQMTFEQMEEVENAYNDLLQINDLVTVSLSIFENGSIPDGGEVSPWAMPYKSVLISALDQLRRTEKCINAHIRASEIV